MVQLWGVPPCFVQVSPLWSRPESMVSVFMAVLLMCVPARAPSHTGLMLYRSRCLVSLLAVAAVLVYLRFVPGGAVLLERLAVGSSQATLVSLFVSRSSPSCSSCSSPSLSQSSWSSGRLLQGWEHFSTVLLSWLSVAGWTARCELPVG